MKLCSQAARAAGAGAAIRVVRNAKAPSPTKATVNAATARKAGYSQPPLGAVKSQPFGAWMTNAPRRMGSSNSDTIRAWKPMIRATPPAISASTIGQAKICGRPTWPRNPAKPAREDRKFQIGMGDEHDAECYTQQRKRHREQDGYRSWETSSVVLRAQHFVFS